MDIKVLPYIDQTQIRSGQETGSVQKTEEADFAETLATAERAIKAITVDLVSSGDADKIREAARILSASRAPQLQQMGQALMSSADAISSDQGAGASLSSLQEAAAQGSGADPAVQSNSFAAQPGGSKAQAEDSAAQTQESVPKTAGADAGNTSEAAQTLPSPLQHSSEPGEVSETLGCPEELRDFFEEASEAYGVDVAFLEAIAKAESNFRPDAKSSAGATGVMQLMPSTAEELGVEDATDAKQNIMGGAKLIASLLEKYDGDSSLALAAYNAGSGNVAKYGGIPPFAETQGYVKKVLGYYGDTAVI